MSARVVSFPRLVPEPETNASPQASIELAQLLTVVEQIEGEFVELIDLLQREREHMVTLELPSLVRNAMLKDELLRRIAAQAPIRRPVFERAWAWAGHDPAELPATVPVALRGLSDVAGARRAEICEVANRLDALMDTIEDLQVANRGLVQRALAWIDGYLAELTGEPGAVSYDASGRLRDRAASLLRRTV